MNKRRQRPPLLEWRSFFITLPISELHAGTTVFPASILQAGTVWLTRVPTLSTLGSPGYS
jgi:hypothetical protein